MPVQITRFSLRYFIRLSYHGKNFHGWQIQPNAPSVQETLNEALSRITGTEIYVVGAGRTDTGVHAKQMWAHFDSAEILNSNLVHKLNSYLKEDVAIQEILTVADEAHARFDAIRRSYEYHIVLEKDPFLNDQAWQLHQKPDLEKMKIAAKQLFDYEDFSAFSRSNTQTKTNICQIEEASWTGNNKALVFHISANRFLRNMVRAIVGTIVEIGLNKRPLEDFSKIIESKDRRLAGESAPAHGLFLTEVKYPKELLNGK